MSNLIFVNSQKGKKLLSYDGYLHSLHRSTENKCIWRYIEFINYKCKGCCHTTNDEESGEIIKIPTHRHPPNPDKVNIKEAIDKLKNEAKMSCEPTRNVSVWRKIQNSGLQTK
ncbi:uncharacterized protein LOC112593423 isoform X3 [Melanaphis sacchari]|uniref:uncharacterized protein LOC112593423 isoform X3 n=1 Tax=Melanaphis sacchari TaxID=742174 RepID=UPI000DC15AA3|nr:uncharacterized protein LOC112593423 isoform X3 [Melanaphis sacchari]